MDITTIRISKETLKELKLVGNKAETYDKIINRLIEIYKNSKFT